MPLGNDAAGPGRDRLTPARERRRRNLQLCGNSAFAAKALKDAEGGVNFVDGGDGHGDVF